MLGIWNEAVKDGCLAQYEGHKEPDMSLMTEQKQQGEIVAKISFTVLQLYLSHYQVWF